MRNRSATYSPDEVFGALADPTRRAVLDLLRSGDRPAGDIAQRFPVSRPAISKHLRQLRRAGLVAETRSGRHRLYRLNAEPLQTVAGWLDAYRDHWRSKLENLKAYVESTEPVTRARSSREAAAGTNNTKPRNRRGATR
jgi:DNA-binding transcriptional ArsR family regulator